VTLGDTYRAAYQRRKHHICVCRARTLERLAVLRRMRTPRLTILLVRYRSASFNLNTAYSAAFLAFGGLAGIRRFPIVLSTNFSINDALQWTWFDVLTRSYFRADTTHHILGRRMLFYYSNVANVMAAVIQPRLPPPATYCQRQHAAPAPPPARFYLSTQRRPLALRCQTPTCYVTAPPPYTVDDY